MKSEKTDKKNLINSVKAELLSLDFKPKYIRLLSTAATVKKKKEDILLAFEEIEDMYNNAPCGYHSLDENGVFVRINDTELRWLGESRNHFTGTKKISDVLTPDSREKFRKIFPAFKKNGYLHEEEFYFTRKDGRSFPVLLSASAVYNDKGDYKMSRSVVVDISAHKLMEQQLRFANKDLQQKNEALSITNEHLFFMNREKERFMDIATHDLQLPLVAISMLSETLLKNNIPSGSAEEQQVIGMIHDASLEMRSLLANYLSLSLSETGKMQLVIREIDINVLTNEIVNRYLPIAQKKNIQLHFKNNKNFLLFTDRECCAQVIDNLVSNAVKYTVPGKNITIAITGNQQDVKIIIADEGPGIKKEDQLLLFKRFQKLAARPTGGELSTGLGLSIVKYLVGQLKGNISVDSELGKGSVFTVYLPLNNEG